MPKKRASTKSRKDEQKKEVDTGFAIFPEDDDAKRAKLEPLNDTTLQHLPIELLESILVNAVAMEVLELKVARCAHKEQAELVIRRLRTVCSHWNSVLTTDIFRIEVHKLLEGEETLVFDILDQPSIPVKVLKLTTLKDEIFLLCGPLDGGTMVINVYDRNNMTEVKDVISLPRITVKDMTACSVSNCVYILNTEKYRPSIFRITKEEEHRFKMSPWLNNLGVPVTDRVVTSVSAMGNLIILSSEQCWARVFIGARSTGFAPIQPSYVVIYAKDGLMQHQITLTPDVYGFRIINSAIQKSGGNLVLLATNNENEAKLLEIDTRGRILRQYQSSHFAYYIHGYRVMSFADDYGRILVTDKFNKIKLFDRLFNPLEIGDPQPSSRGFLPGVPLIHFNSDRNEIVRLEQLKYGHKNCGRPIDEYFNGSVLSIFRLRSE